MTSGGLAATRSCTSDHLSTQSNTTGSFYAVLDLRFRLRSPLRNFRRSVTVSALLYCTNFTTDHALQTL